MFSRKKYDYDLIVIGSGAGGSVGAHFARSLNKKVAIFEKEFIGGECPNIGCVPTKALLHAAHVYETVLGAANYGTEVKGVSFNYEKVKAWRDLVVDRTGVHHGEESFKEDGIDLFKGEAQFINSHEIECRGKHYSARYFLVATGSSVFIPPVPGLEETGYITFREAIDFTKLPESVFILGGGAIGCEFAQVFSSFGSKVIIGDLLPKLLAKEDAEVSELVQALFENRGVKVLTGIEVLKIEKAGGKKRIHYKLGKEEHSVSADEILVATGKRPNIGFAPEKAGIKVDHGHIKVNSELQTSCKNIFAAGDVVGPWLFTHTGYYQSYLAVNNMFLHKKIKQDFEATPRCVFTYPEVASVGLSEHEANERGIKTKKGMCAVSLLGRANTSNELDGFIKVVTDKKGTIIGGAIISTNAGEMIHELTLAVKLRLNASVLANMLHAYPTYSEGIKIACSNLE